MTDEIKQLVYAIKNDGVLNGHDTPNNEWERQIQELIAKAIEKDILELIGEDEDWDKKYSLSIKQDIKSRNRLRYQLRLKLKEYMK
jgi:hypothetical protein